jgi:hypothetical protein
MGPLVEENTSPGEETIIVSLLRYGRVACILRVYLYPGGVGGSVITRAAKKSPKASEIAIPRSAGLTLLAMTRWGCDASA